MTATLIRARRTATNFVLDHMKVYQAGAVGILVVVMWAIFSGTLLGPTVLAAAIVLTMILHQMSERVLSPRPSKR
jgi:hypothetical protein